MDAGQLQTPDQFAALLIASFYPEKTNRESAIIRDFLRAHLYEFSGVQFSVHIGDGAPIDPALDANIQKTAKYSTQKRIDVLAWQGNQPWIIECKYRVVPAALGQLHTYSLLWLEENPGARTPKLVVIGRYSDADTNKALFAHGVDVYLYPETTADGGAADGAVSPGDASAEA
jgi:hypothetical protein